MKQIMESGTETMIKILFFIPGLSEGGAEKVMCNLVNNLDQSTFDITVQTIDKYEPNQYLADGIHYKAINRCRTRMGKKLFLYWFRLCAELKVAYRFFVKADYDIEVAYLETAATKIIAQSTNKKAIKLAWVHCDLSKKEGMRQSVKKVRKQYARYDKIVCVSEDVRRGFIDLYGRHYDTVVLHNVIDDTEILKKAQSPITIRESNDNKMRFLALGRLTYQKNFAYLIDTCARLHDDGFKFQLDILGSGPEKENLEKQINALGLKDYVKLRGYEDNPYPWMKKADVIVCSSRYEGISSVILEALFLGKAVITTPCSGMTEILGKSIYGMIAEDSDHGLYDCMKCMITDSKIKVHYEQKALERRKDFSKEEILKETETFFFKIKQD